MKKKIIRVAFGIIIVLAVILFIFANFRMIKSNYHNISDFKIACSKLSPGDFCEFETKRGVVEGVCKNSIRGDLVCKINNKK